jgi:transposase
MDKIIRIGMDTSKHVFQLHGVNAGEKPVLRKKMRRKEMIDFFTTCPPTQSRSRPVVVPIIGRGYSPHLDMT